MFVCLFFEFLNGDVDVAWSIFDELPLAKRIWVVKNVPTTNLLSLLIKKILKFLYWVFKQLWLITEISLYLSVLRPILYALQIFSPVQFDTRPAMLHSQSIPHHCNWIHWSLIRKIWWFHPNYSILIINVSVWINLPQCFLLFLYLLLTVKNEIQILGLLRFDRLLWKISL
jgi:hypothetical protein